MHIWCKNPIFNMQLRYVYTLRLIGPISYLGGCYRRTKVTKLKHIHQDTKSARFIAVCKRGIRQLALYLEMIFAFIWKWLLERLPHIWKCTNITPIPKNPSIEDFNKDLRSISLTSTTSKIAEDYVVREHVKSAVLRHISLLISFIRLSFIKFIA